MQIPDPHYMELADWANGTVYALGEYTSIAQFFPDTDWQRWGMQFFNNPSLGLLGPPNPYDFKDWKPWAERLQDAMLNATGVEVSTVGGSATSRFLMTQGNQFLTTQLGQLLVTQ